ncbi:nucleoside hydrolase [Anaerotignum sp.]|uniref:nucleoside hydrolase n=1 Tax=Anaerotignum sp. TaxID=2039241 RepID=UPI003330B625
MRRIIIDTDCGSDDAVALMMALKSKKIHIEAITTVCGNVPVELATKNTLMTIEVVNKQQPPVYVGAANPLMRKLVTAGNVHGEDGMGDLDLIHPTISEEHGYAVDAILKVVNGHPNEVEIVALGPVTNIALAILKDPKIMQKVKHIYSMGTAGFGRGNASPVAEYNVFVDAEAYDIMLKSGIPITIIGFDVCLGDAALNSEDMDMLLASEKKEAIFAVECNRSLFQFNLKQSGGHFVDLPDAIAMGVALWPDILLESVSCFCHTCIMDPFTYGQVIINDKQLCSIQDAHWNKKGNATLCKKIDTKAFKSKLFQVLTN